MEPANLLSKDPSSLKGGSNIYATLTSLDGTLSQSVESGIDVYRLPQSVGLGVIQTLSLIKQNRSNFSRYGTLTISTYFTCKAVILIIFIVMLYGSLFAEQISFMYIILQRDDTEVVDEPLYAHYLSVTGVDRPYRQELLSKMVRKYHCL